MPGQALSVADALAAALAERGVASLRFDKRGVSESEGDYLTAGFQAETDDAFAAFRALRGLPGVDTERVAVIGLSVGATIAMRIAAAEKGLAGVVLLAGSHRPGTEVMERQSKRIAESLRRPSQAWIEAAT
jgi:alpha/beta superfamily hydrolase